MRILYKCKEFYDYIVSIYEIDNDVSRRLILVPILALTTIICFIISLCLMGEILGVVFMILAVIFSLIWRWLINSDPDCDLKI